MPTFKWPNAGIMGKVTVTARYFRCKDVEAFSRGKPRSLCTEDSAYAIRKLLIRKTITDLVKDCAEIVSTGHTCSCTQWL
jgi:hypothetical protein